MPNYLCCCTPFALWAGCEHCQCVRAQEDGEFKLTTPGQNLGGRGRTNEIHYGLRGVSAKITHRRIARALAKSASKLARGKQARASSTHYLNPASWRYAGPAVGGRSDTNTVGPCSGQPIPRSSAVPPQDELMDILIRAGCGHHHDTLTQRGFNARTLQLGKVSAEMLDK